MPLLVQAQDGLEAEGPRGPGEMRPASEEERNQFLRPGGLFEALPMPDVSDTPPARTAGDKATAADAKAAGTQAQAAHQVTGTQKLPSLLFPDPEIYVEIPEEEFSGELWQSRTQGAFATTVRSVEEKWDASDDPMALTGRDAWSRTLGVGVETKVTDKAVLTYDSRLGVSGAGETYEGDPAVSSLTPSQRLAARVNVLPRLTVTGAYENRSVVDEDIDTPTGVDRTVHSVEASVQAWQGASITGDFREESDKDGESGEQVGGRHAMGVRLNQDIPNLPLSASLGTRLEDELDVTNPDQDLIERRPMVEGALTWTPKPVLSLKVGVRRQDWEDALGVTDRTENTWFAEHHQELSKRVDWLSRAQVQDQAQYTGALEQHDRNATLSVGPRIEISDTFNANLEMLQRWDDDSTMDGWTPGERRISFSITGEF